MKKHNSKPRKARNVPTRKKANPSLSIPCLEPISFSNRPVIQDLPERTEIDELDPKTTVVVESPQGEYFKTSAARIYRAVDKFLENEPFFKGLNEIRPKESSVIDHEQAIKEIISKVQQLSDPALSNVLEAVNGYIINRLRENLSKTQEEFRNAEVRLDGALKLLKG